MLVLARKAGQSIIINDNIIVKLVSIQSDAKQVKIGIEAPKEISIVREELVNR